MSTCINFRNTPRQLPDMSWTFFMSFGFSHHLVSTNFRISLLSEIFYAIILCTSIQCCSDVIGHQHFTHWDQWDNSKSCQRIPHCHNICQCQTIVNSFAHHVSLSYIHCMQNIIIMVIDLYGIMVIFTKL